MVEILIWGSVEKLPLGTPQSSHPHPRELVDGLIKGLREPVHIHVNKQNDGPREHTDDKSEGG